MQTKSPQHGPSPLITFIVPCYNLPADLVCTCIRSILSLPLGKDEREILIIDDGSSQPVEAHLKPFGSDIRCLRQANGGLSAARNTGLAHASGRYIQFVDGDDSLCPEAYAQCVRKLKEEHPDVLLFRFQGHEDKALPPMSGAAYMRHHNLRASACTYLFRRTLAGELRFPTGMLHEDEAFTPQLVISADKVCDTGIGAYAYRRRPHSITTDTTHTHLAQRLSDKEAVVLLLQRLAAQLPPQKAGAMRRRVAQLTMDYLVDTIRLAKEKQAPARTADRLRQHGLYPLPLHTYTLSYFLFSLLSATRPGLSFLRFAIRHFAAG